MFSVHVNGKAYEILDDLKQKAISGNLNNLQKDLYRKLIKTIKFLEENPRHPGLSSHEIHSLSAKYDVKIWESYLENKCPSARRIFWIYGPENKEITIVGIEQHPNPTKGFSRVKLDV